MNKQELRKQMNQTLSSLPNKEESSHLISVKLLNSRDYINASTIGIYLSTPNEVNTEEIITKALSDNKKVFVPVCEENDMKFYELLPLDSFTTNKYNIKEPSIKRNHTDNLDLIIVPCLAIDKQGNRLGHGKGYYDRYLKNKNVNTITICFKQQLVPCIPHENHDIKIKAIIHD